MSTMGRYMGGMLLLALLAPGPTFAREGKLDLQESIAALESDNATTLKHAIDTLADLGPVAKEAEAKLWTLFHAETDPSMKLRIGKTLVKIVGKQDFWNKAQAVSPKEWADQLSDYVELDTRNKIESILLEVADKPSRDHRELVISAAHVIGTDPKAKEAAVEIQTAILKKDENPKIRQWAAYSLVQYGHAARSAVPALIEALDDPDKYVKQAAVFATTQIAPSEPAVVEKLHAMLLDSLTPPGDVDLSASILRHIGQCGTSASVAVPDLLRIATDNDTDILLRRLALWALWNIPSSDTAALPELIELLQQDQLMQPAASVIQNVAFRLSSDDCNAIRPLRKAYAQLRGQPGFMSQRDTIS